MLGLNRVATAVRDGLWLVRKSGLRQRLDALDQRTGALENLARDLLAHARQADQQLQSLHTDLRSSLDRTQEIDQRLRSRSRVFGHEMFLDPADPVVSPQLLCNGYFEPFETALIESEIRPGDVVLDIGAKIGYYTLIFARLVGEHGRVYAFEPDPAQFQLLKKNVRANGYQNVVVVNKAVSDATQCRCVGTVATTALDDHFGEFQGEINFIKLDVQGGEGRAVRGMTRLLQRYPELRLVTEFRPAALRRAGIPAREYLAELENLGFQLFRIDEAEETAEPTSADELLARYPEDREEHADLYCARCA
jgi:hypothetical protein